MNKDKIVTLVSSILMSLMIVLSTLGLTSYSDLIKNIIPNIEGVVNASFVIVEFVLGVLLSWKTAQNLRAGTIVRKQFDAKSKGIGARSTESFFEFTRKSVV